MKEECPVGSVAWFTGRIMGGDNRLGLQSPASRTVVSLGRSFDVFVVIVVCLFVC